LSVFNTNVNRILELPKAVERRGKGRLPEKVGVEAGGPFEIGNCRDLAAKRGEKNSQCER
jgi:hypothetical protein